MTRQRRIGLLAALLAGACGNANQGPTTGTSSVGGTATTAATDAATATTGTEGSGTTAATGQWTTGWTTGSPDDWQPCEVSGDLGTNKGCQFWAVDLPNAWWNVQGNLGAAYQQFAVVVANTDTEEEAEVRVFRGDEDTDVDRVVVPVGEIHAFELEALNIQPDSNSYDGVAYRIESTVPIIAYQFNPLENITPPYSNDASLLFPSHALGSDYAAITGDAITLADEFNRTYNGGAFVSVVATADETTIDVSPTAAVYPGALTGITLDRGQVATILSRASGGSIVAGDGNLSGTRVTSDKPVAVFSGNVATLEPTLPTYCCADHQEHQMIPFVAWGTSYVAAPAPEPIDNDGGDANDASLYRITGAQADIELTYDPASPDGAPTMLGAFETVTFVTDQPFTVKSNDKLFVVTQFLQSNQQFSGGTSSYPGDPAMMVLPASAQFESRYVFLIPAGYAHNFVTVIAEAGSAVTLDGNTIEGSQFQALGSLDGKTYVFAQVRLAPGHHNLESDQPSAILVTGFDDDVSFGYPGGAGLRVISENPM